MMHPISPISPAYEHESTMQSPSIPAQSVSFSPSAEMIREQLVALLHTEESYRVREMPCIADDDMIISENGNSNYEGWRRAICEWSFKVVDHFGIDREAVGIALNFFDRYLVLQEVQGDEKSTCRCPSCLRAVDSSTFQLAAMTALYIAIKIHAESDEDIMDTDILQTRRKKLRLVSFVDLSRGQFSCEDICSMETKMLHTLGWKVNPPTPMLLISYLLKLMPPPAFVPYHCQRHYDLILRVLYEIARYLSELSVCLSDVYTGASPSEVAYACIIGAMEMLTIHALPTQVRTEFCDTVARLATGSDHALSSEWNVQKLKERLLHDFSPDMLLDEGDDDDAQKSHPIAQALRAGLLVMSPVAPLSPLRNKRQSSATSVMTQHDQLGMESEMRGCITP